MSFLVSLAFLLEPYSQGGDTGPIWRCVLDGPPPSPQNEGEREWRYPEEASSQKLSREGVGGWRDVVYFRVLLTGALVVDGCSISSHHLSTLPPSFLSLSHPLLPVFPFIFQVINLFCTGRFSHSWQTCSNQPHPKVNHGPLSTPDPFPAELLGGSLLWVFHSLSPLSREDEGGSSRTHLQTGLVSPPRECGSIRKARETRRDSERESQVTSSWVKRKVPYLSPRARNIKAQQDWFIRKKTITLRCIKATQQYYTAVVSFGESGWWVWGGLTGVHDKGKGVKVIITKLSLFLSQTSFLWKTKSMELQRVGHDWVAEQQQAFILERLQNPEVSRPFWKDSGPISASILWSPISPFTWGQLWGSFFLLSLVKPSQASQVAQW